MGEVAALFADACTITLTAFISPYRADRAQVRALVPDGRFVEVFVDTPLAICESRDPKGLYQKARAGEIAQFTGISAPYEAPESPEIRLQTEGCSVDESAAEVVDWFEAKGFISR